jgi:aryl-alcohol dehydrogenase-like predicted oxidoreductase
MTSETRHQPRRLGSTGPTVFPLALGCMGMSGMYGPADERESIATIHAALDAGVTLLDTGDYYGAGHNELLIGRAVRDRHGKALLSVKFGAMRGPDTSWLGMDARPAALKNFLSYTLTRLGVDHVDIYRPGRPDRGDRRRHRRSDQGRLRPRDRLVGGGAGHHSPRAGRAPDQRSAD